MIKSVLSGGLGNQMFQYAFARSLQIETKNKLALYIDSFISDQWGREYSLRSLSVPDYIPVRKFSKFGYLFYRFIRFFYHRFDRIVCWKKCYITTRNEYDYFSINTLKLSRLLYADQVFQSHKWFDKHRELIRKELQVATPPSARNFLLIKEISTYNSICVHIRRGDYLDSRWKHLNICNYKYYREAMEYIEAHQENPVFYIFSNNHEDIEWIRQNYDFSNFTVVYVDENNPDYEELRLMYSCKHFIISNSTFSWWAQYLSDNEGKIVCAPSEWNRGKNVDCSNIYMPEWHLIEV